MPLFPYNRDIPDAPNDPSADQPLMKANTNNIDNIIDEDHFSFDENNGGLHRQVRLPLRGGSPGTIPPGLIAGEGTLYTKTVTSSGVLTETGLFYTPDNSTNQYQLTRTITAAFAKLATNLAYPSNASPAGATTTGGWTFLPGGLLLQYGTVTSPGNPSTTVDFPIPFTSAPFSMTISIKRNSGSNDNLFINTKTATTFTYFASTSGAGFQSFDWMAIGI